MENIYESNAFSVEVQTKNERGDFQQHVTNGQTPCLIIWKADKHTLKNKDVLGGTYTSHEVIPITDRFIRYIKKYKGFRSGDKWSHAKAE